jgi:NMD protein affecting ribosome stability and mRNA decay
VKILCHVCGIDHQIIERRCHVCVDCDAKDSSLIKAIKEILSYAESKESRLDLLTSIWLDSGSDEVLDATEAIRSEIADQSIEPRRYVEPRGKNKTVPRPESESVLDKEIGEDAK